MSGPHLIGCAGEAPDGVIERLRGSLHRYGVDDFETHVSPLATVLFGPSRECVVAKDGAAFATVVGQLLSTRAASSLAEAVDQWRCHAPAQLRFEGVLLVEDRDSGVCCVARDHLGYGSVYWTLRGRAAFFATELPLLLAALDTRPSPDETAIALWLSLDSSRSDLSFYEGISQVPAGHSLILGDKPPRLQRYWTPVYEPPKIVTIADAMDELRPAIRDAVARRIDPEGRTGVLMSGGLDSAAVAGFARTVDDAVSAYSDVFPTAPEVDESAWIDEVVRFLGVESVRSAVRPQGVVVDLAEFIERWNGPPDSANYWGKAILDEARRSGVGTLFTGEGGDEVFAVHETVIADMLRRGRVRAATRLTRMLPHMLFYPPPRRLALAMWRHGVVPAYRTAARANSRRTPGGGTTWLKPALRDALDHSRDPDGWRGLDGPIWWRKAVYGFTTAIPAVGVPALFRRTGETAGLRVCSPLLDVDLVEAALSCSPTLAFNGILSKPLLRASADGLIPDSVRLRRGKTRFVRMVVDGIRGSDFAFMARILSNPDAEIRRYVDHESVVRDLVERPPSGYGDDAAEWSFLFYRFVALECWLRHERDPAFLSGLRPGLPPRAATISYHNAQAPDG